MYVNNKRDTHEQNTRAVRDLNKIISCYKNRKGLPKKKNNNKTEQMNEFILNSEYFYNYNARTIQRMHTHQNPFTTICLICVQYINMRANTSDRGKYM